MTETSLQKTGLHSTRLIRFLSDLAVTDVAFSPKKFSERLGRLIDFGESIRISALHEKLHTIIVEPTPISSETLKEDVLRVRMLLVQSVIKSFIPADETDRVKLPALNVDACLDQLAAFEPYHHFYVSHQREFEYKIQSLQLRVKDTVCEVSTELAQLAALDEALRNTLSQQNRKYLAVIPKLLGKRFDFLLQEYLSLQERGDREANPAQADEEMLKTWMQPNGWLDRFFKEMQGLLLAELEFRLLPVLGLIEAVDEQIGNKR